MLLNYLPLLEQAAEVQLPRILFPINATVDTQQQNEPKGLLHIYNGLLPVHKHRFPFTKKKTKALDSFQYCDYYFIPLIRLHIP